MWLAIPIVLALLLAVVSFIAGIAPLGIGLLVVAAGLAAFQRKQGGASAARAERQEAHDPTQPLGTAHEGQEHMTPDEIPSPRG